jgi:hypothetical protein
MNGIIGFIILIILFNVLNRILRAAARRQQAPPSPRPGAPAERPPSEEAPSTETGTSRTVESWLEEIFEEKGEGGRTVQSEEFESAAPGPAADHMRRYADFERHAESEIDRTERLARERRAARLESTTAERASVAAAVAVETRRAADPVYALLRNAASLRAAFVAAEILGPCRARVVQRSRAPRAARSVLG